jgi:hypothetical protein
MYSVTFTSRYSLSNNHQTIFDDIRFKIKSNAMYSVTFTSRYSLSNNHQTIKEIQAYVDTNHGMVGSILLNFNIIGSHEIFEMLL